MDGRGDLDLDHLGGGEKGRQEKKEGEGFGSQRKLIIRTGPVQVNRARPPEFVLDFLFSIN
jgi:hypothetical protein